MAATTPPIPASLPTPPSTANPSDFDTKADAFNAALAGFQTDTNAVAANVYANALEAKAQADAAAAQNDAAATQASDAASSAATAAAVAGASLWVSGTTYTKGTPVISTVNVLLYRRLIAGGGTTDPSLDTTNWALAVPMTPASIATSSVFLSTNFGAL